MARELYELSNLKFEFGLGKNSNSSNSARLNYYQVEFNILRVSIE